MVARRQRRRERIVRLLVHSRAGGNPANRKSREAAIRARTETLHQAKGRVTLTAAPRDGSPASHRRQCSAQMLRGWVSDFSGPCPRLGGPLGEEGERVKE